MKADTSKYAKVDVIAGVLIEKDNKYLLIQEKQDPVAGLWNFPAGHVDIGDTIENTAIKEAKEESGYEVVLKEKIAIFHDTMSRPVAHIFHAEIIGGKLDIPDDEIMDARWYSYDEVRKLGKALRSNIIIKSIDIFNSKK